MKISYNKLRFGHSKAIALSTTRGHHRPSPSKGSAVRDGNGRLATKDNNGIVPLSNLCAADGRELNGAWRSKQDLIVSQNISIAH